MRERLLGIAQIRGLRWEPLLERTPTVKRAERGEEDSAC